MEQKIKSQDLVEALEQVRASFTVSRMAFGAITLLYSLRSKDQKWVKKFEKIQREYHQFLLDSYNELLEEENRLRQIENEPVDDIPEDVVETILNNQFTADTK